MTLYASSTGLVLEAATSPTPSSVNSTHLAHISPNPSPESAIDNPPKDALLKLASSSTLLQILERLVELFPLQERVHPRLMYLTAPRVHRHRQKLQSRVQRP